MKRLIYKFVLLMVGALFFCNKIKAQSPPFSGTIFLDPDIVTSSDPTTFTGLVATGQGMRTMFDRRVNAFITLNAYLFNASYSDSPDVEIQVNPEFGSAAAAMVEANIYASLIGQLPNVLRKDLNTVWIHMGVQPFGGGNNNILIHTGQTTLYENDGILEETLIHEACHTSLDNPHATSTDWINTQNQDPTFISTYARDNPTREDIAESFLCYLAIRYRSDRISSSLKNTIMQTIPNRIAYFDAQSFNVSPITSDYSITSISAATPACNGNDATFNVSFTPPASGVSGTIEVLDGTTVVGSGTSSPIAVTISGPTSAATKTLTVRYQDNTACNGTVDVSIPACMAMLAYDSNNELMFGDPCSCDDPRNCEVSGVTFFHDTLTVTTGGVSGLTITAAASATDFYTTVPCFGGTLTLIPTGTVIPENPAGSGEYKIEFWRPSGATPTLSVVESGTTTPVPSNTFQPVCTMEACTPSAPIPTMNAWGLLIFGLMVVNMGVFFVQRRVLI